MISAGTFLVECMALFWSLCDLLDSGYPDAWCSRLSVSRGQVSGVIGKIVFSDLSCFVVTGICSTRFGSLFRQGLLLTVFVSDCQVVYLSAQIAEANLQGDEERPGSYVCLCNGGQVAFSSWSCLCIEGQKCMEKMRRCMMGTVPIIQQVRCLYMYTYCDSWQWHHWDGERWSLQRKLKKKSWFLESNKISFGMQRNCFFPFTEYVCCSRLKRKSWRPIELIHAAECTTNRTTSLTCVEVSRQLKSPWSVSKWKHCWTLPQASWTLVWEITWHFFSSQFSKSFTPSGKSWVEKQDHETSTWS